MSIIACGYLILILCDLLLRINIMYLFIPYAVITLIIIEYTRKRSKNYDKYFIGFEVEPNNKFQLLKFFIFTFNKNSKSKNAVILKYSEFRTLILFDFEQMPSMLNDLGYILIIPHYVAQLNFAANFYKVVHAKECNSITVSESYYEDILVKYKQFKAAVINKLKQDVNSGSSNTNTHPLFPSKTYKKRKSLTSFLRN